MFKESDKNTQSDLFGSMSCVLVGRALKVYGNEKGWHNQFRVQVVSRIGELPASQPHVQLSQASWCRPAGEHVRNSHTWTGEGLQCQCDGNSL